MHIRLGTLAVAVLALAALVAVPATWVLAQDGTSAVGPQVTVNATGGDIRAAGGAVTVNGNAANVRAAGADVTVSANAAGSIWAMGAKIAISGSVGADATIAGASISLTGKVTGDTRLVGAVIDVNAPVGGDLRAAAANVTIGPLTEIGGRLEAFGANVSMAGHVHGRARIGGATVTFNGQADGPLTLAGDHIVIGPQARIGGDLTTYSRQDPEIAPEAVVTGSVQRNAPPPTWRNLPGWAFGVGFAVAMVLGTILSGIVLMLFGGRLFLTALDNARLRPVSSILIGIITLVLLLAIAIILSATVVGLPIGLALLLAVPLLFVFGQPIAAAGIAAGIFVRTPGPIGIARALLFVILGAIIIALVSLVPWVGPLAVCIMVLLGLGALVRTAGGRLHTPETRRWASSGDRPLPPPDLDRYTAPPPPPPPPPPPEPPAAPAPPPAERPAS